MNKKEQTKWANEDLWDLGQFIDLCCGLNPDTAMAPDRIKLSSELMITRDRIQKACLAKKLPHIDPSDTQGGANRVYDSKTRMFEPYKAIPWALKKFPETFPIQVKPEPLLDLDKPLTETEKKEMLKIILGMALDKYDFHPSKKRNTATGEQKLSILASLELNNLPSCNDTITKYLKQAAELYEDIIPPLKNTDSK